MKQELLYPFDNKYILGKRRVLKKELLLQDNLLEKHIAILGGSTTHDIKEMLELFLLNNGIRPVFYESEFDKYYEDAMFPPADLVSLKPDIIFIHTTFRNLKKLPELDFSKNDTENLINETYQHYVSIWGKLSEQFHCPIIQNNFEMPFNRPLGNLETSDWRGSIYFANRLNLLFCDYAQEHKNFYINDINYLAADFGLEKWSNPSYWYLYKYALSTEAIPNLAYSVSNIIKSIFGKNKKALAIDLDNTLWGGIIGDDGPEGITLGNESARGEAFTAFQDYLLKLKKQGILLNIVSKNEEDNAKSGLNHPQMRIKPDDFISIKTNWLPKSENLVNIANEINLLPESFVFVDDNPAEREIILQQVPGVGIPKLDKPENYIRELDKVGYFEPIQLSKDDLNRHSMYKENAERTKLQNSFADYSDYLRSLNMKATIKPFESLYLTRICQLTNKTNQFNLTTRRYTQDEIDAVSISPDYICLYGQLEDRFGDNGVVAITIGKIEQDTLNLVLWLMSCRVLKRDLELAMLDTLVKKAKQKNISYLKGYFYPTAKNKMVCNFYGELGFDKVFEDEAGNSEWLLNINEYKNKNNVMDVNEV